VDFPRRHQERALQKPKEHTLEDEPIDLNALLWTRVSNRCRRDNRG
jgi:hypothetical protein